MLTHLLATAAAVVAAPVQTRSAPQPTAVPRPAATTQAEAIPFEQFTLPNGLRVVVHTDKSVPKVAVSVWYHVGSMNEPEGKTGFAHLFEHLMFNGSEHRDDEYMPPLQEVGVSAVNGATSLDQTYYFEVVPTAGLERVLWLESDRMGYLLGAVTQAKLDEQRGVVKNEKRTYQNQPYWMVDEMRARALFPAGHPYHHPTIGSVADLDAAKLEDVRDWFRRYYGATNAVVVLAGDVTVERARELVTKYFGSVAPGEPVARVTAWVPTLERTRSEVIQEKVPQPLVSWSWPVPGSDTADTMPLRMTAAVLGRGRLARLHQALVIDHPYATDVNVNYQGSAIAGVFTVDVRLKPGVDRAEVERVLQSVLARYAAEGPTAAELARYKTVAFGDNVRARESLFVRAMTLAGGTILSSGPGDYAKDDADYAALTPAQVRQAAQTWLTQPNYRLTVEPFGQFRQLADGADRSALPALGPTGQLTLPERQEARLANGMRVVFSRRVGTPTVDLLATFDAGGAADLSGKPGLQDFTLGLMGDGTATLTSNAFAERSEQLGARINAYGDSDSSTFYVSSLTRSLDPTIELWADMIRRPGFRPEDLARDRENALQGVRQSETDPNSLASRAYRYALFGSDHAYGTRLAGRAETISSFSRDDVSGFHDRWIRPDNGVIYASGDVEFSALLRTLNAAFGDWRAPAVPKGVKRVAPLSAQTASRVILIDKPGAIQSVIRVGQIMPDGLNPANFELEAVNGLLGGGFTSRLNMNLREEKGWTYGANSSIGGGTGPQAFTVATGVQTDKTADALREIAKELHGLTGDRPATTREIDLLTRGEVLTLADRFETNYAMVGYLSYVDRYGHPYEWLATLPDRYAALTPATIGRTAGALHPDAMTWVVVGDLSKMEEGVRGLNLGAVEVWDAAAKRLR